ncbi:MAG: DNA internalization-related competence protein ComEC/Rec2 [Polyangiaceae bacterium]
MEPSRRIDGWLSLAVAAYVGGAAVFAPLATTLGAAAALVVLLRARVLNGRGALALVGVFTLFAGRAYGREVSARAAYHAASELPTVACTLSGYVVASPVVSADDERFVLEVENEAPGPPDCDPPRTGQVVPSSLAGLRVDVRGDRRDLRRGDRVRVRGVFRPPYLFENEGALPGWLRVARSGAVLSGHADELELLERGSGPAASIDRFRAHVRRRIERTYHGDAAALGRALVLGESDLTEDVSRSFRITGLSHILAVSGTHLVVTVMSVAAALRALLVRWSRLARAVVAERVSSSIAIALAWLYSDFAGGSGSVVRAAAMLTVVLGARALGRRPTTARSVALALAFGLAGDPTIVADISFTLSMAATCGLLTLSRPLAAILGAEAKPEAGVARRAWAAIATPIATTLGATLACAPITVLLGGQLPLAGIVANIVAAPLGETFALPFAIVHALVSPLSWFERGLAWVASGALRAVLAIARLAADADLTLELPPPTGAHLAVLGVSALLAWLARSPRERLVRVVLASIALVTVEAGVRSGAHPSHLRATVLDVGQGDSLLVDLPDGEVMLIDAGGFPGQALDVGERVVVPALRARRRKRIDIIVLSHPHPDHYGGLEAVIAYADSIGEIWDSGYARMNGTRTVPHLLELAQKKGARIVGPEELCAGPRQYGGATVDILAPCPAVDPAVDANDASIVFRISLGAHAMLFTGDAEHDAERHLLALDPLRLRADVLKVGHHGSRTSSSPELVSAVDPAVAVISCGVRNRFGHPHPETMETLTRLGVPVVRTDRGGAWVWETNGEETWSSR